MTAQFKNRFRPEFDTLEDRNLPSTTALGGLTHIMPHGLPIITARLAQNTAHADGLPILTHGEANAASANVGALTNHVAWNPGLIIHTNGGWWGGNLARLNHVPKPGETFIVSWGDGTASVVGWKKIGDGYYVFGFHYYARAGSFQTHWLPRTAGVQAAGQQPAELHSQAGMSAGLDAYFAQHRHN